MPFAICQANDIRSAGINDSQSSLHSSSLKVLDEVSSRFSEVDKTSNGNSHSANSDCSVTSSDDEGTGICSTKSLLFSFSPLSCVIKFDSKDKLLRGLA